MWRVREYTHEDRQKENANCEPSDLQREIQALNYEEFIRDTNIREIIKNEHFNGSDDFCEDAMVDRLKFYYEFRMRTHKWHSNAIRNLRFNECDCKRKGKHTKSNDHSRSSNKSHSSKEPSELQKQIIAMDYDTFVNETNIKELVEHDFQITMNERSVKRDIQPNDIEIGLKSYFKFRLRPEIWHKNSLKNIKLKKCECRRNKTFVETSTETTNNETIKLDKSTYTNLVELSIHHVTDDEIIDIQYDLDSAESSESTSNPELINPSKVLVDKSTNTNQENLSDSSEVSSSQNNSKSN